MSRTIIRVPSENPGQNELAIRQKLEAEGFKEKTTATETYWQQGLGIATAPKYIKVEYGAQEIVISAWVRGFGLMESNLSGFVGIIPKKELQGVVDRLKAIIL